MRKDAGALMSFPNESEENIYQAGQDQDAPSLEPVRYFPQENESKQTELPSNEVPRKRLRLKKPDTITVLLVSVIYLLSFGINHLFFPTGATPPTTNTQDTPTAQVSMAQETSTVLAGNATATALETVVSHMSPQAIYQTYTQGKPLFSDTLTYINNTYFYDPDTMKPDPGCAFQKDGLHITVSNVGTWLPCNNSAFPDLMSFSFQYNFSLLKGDGAGLRFRASGFQSYYFAIDASGNYSFLYYSDVTNGKTARTIQSGSSNLMPKGYGVKNQLTLVAIGDLFYFYLNQKFFMSATDQTLTIGGLSLLANSETAPTEAVFSQAVAWNIAGMAP